MVNEIVACGLIECALDFSAYLGKYLKIDVLVLKNRAVVHHILLFITDLSGEGDGVKASACSLIGLLLKKHRKALGSTGLIRGDRKLFKLN